MKKISKISGIIAGLGLLALTSYGNENLEFRINSTQNNSIVETNNQNKLLPYEILNLEKPLGTTNQEYNTLDDIIETASKRIQPEIEIMNRRGIFTENQAIGILADIRDVLKEKGISYNEQRHLNKGLKDKKLDCDLYSSIYMGVAEKAKIPLKLVYIPPKLENGHMFVRWKAPNFTLNWETTCGMSPTDEMYKEKFNSEKYHAPIEISRDKYLEMITEMVALDIQSKKENKANLRIYDMQKQNDIEELKAKLQPQQEVYQSFINYLNSRLESDLTNPELFKLRGKAYQNLAYAQVKDDERNGFLDEASKDIKLATKLEKINK